MEYALLKIYRRREAIRRGVDEFDGLFFVSKRMQCGHLNSWFAFMGFRRNEFNLSEDFKILFI